MPFFKGGRQVIVDPPHSRNKTHFCCVNELLRSTAFHVLMFIILEEIKSMDNDDNFKKLADIYRMHFISVTYCCVKNRYKMQWLKRLFYYFLGVYGLIGLSWVYFCSTRCLLGLECPRWLSGALAGMAGMEQLGFQWAFIFLSGRGGGSLQQDRLTSLYGGSGLQEQMSQGDKPLCASTN